MPCNSCGTPTREQSPIYPQINKLQAEAILCGVFTCLDDDSNSLEWLLKKLDYAQIGVSRKNIEDWWDRHQEVDRQRTILIEMERQRRAERKLALGKLTEKERELLGLK